LIDPNNASAFVPPDVVTVTSSYGGSMAVTQSSAIFKVN
jgi:hypothetical protein